MKPARRKLRYLLIAAAIGVITWLLWPAPALRIEFVRFHDADGYRHVVFKMVNSTSVPYHYIGASPTDPKIYCEGSFGSSEGFEDSGPDPFALSEYQLPPNGTVEFTVSSVTATLDETTDMTFKAGVFLTRESQVTNRSANRGTIRTIFNRIRRFFGFQPKDVEPIWSAPVRDFRPTPIGPAPTLHD